ncbi:MAG: DUF424 family protein [Candidatus Omnitrophica bacterium]|nr:DUF424 family protein [Candidatus Omnitrophota bacterium]
MNKIFYKVHLSSTGESILALCDANLIGKKFSSQNLVLDLETFKSFYVGEELNIKEAKKLFENSDSMNIVGKNSIQLAIDLGYAKIDQVLYISGVPHLQIYKIFKKNN